jgi:hypothetical protein
MVYLHTNNTTRGNESEGTLKKTTSSLSMLAEDKGDNIRRRR